MKSLKYQMEPIFNGEEGHWTHGGRAQFLQQVRLGGVEEFILPRRQANGSSTPFSDVHEEELTEIQLNSHRIDINEDSVKFEKFKQIEYECRTLAEKTRMQSDSHTRLVSKILEILRSEGLIRSEMEQRNVYHHEVQATFDARRLVSYNLFQLLGPTPRAII